MTLETLLDAYRDAINDSWEFYDGVDASIQERQQRTLAARKAIVDYFNGNEIRWKNRITTLGYIKRDQEERRKKQ